MYALAHYRHFMQMSLESIHNFMDYFVHKQTGKGQVAPKLLGRGNECH